MARPWYELRLTTDIPAFLTELQAFTAAYVANQREPRLIGFDIGEWQAGYWDPRPIDRSGSPTDPQQSRSLSVRLDYQSTVKEWLRVPVDVRITIQRLNDEQLLLTIPPGDVAGLPFVRALVERAKVLFTATAVQAPADAQNRTEAAIAAYYQRRDTGITLKEIAVEYGLSYEYLRVAKSRYDRKRRSQM